MTPVSAALCLLPALVLTYSLHAQDQPQLVWEGEVDGISIISFRGNRVAVEDRQGLPVQRQRYRFFERLPDSRQDVRMEVREGRGYVRILEQPRLDNNYTLSVAIEDRQSGSSYYSLEFYWRSGPAFFNRPITDRGESLVWSGRVDDEVIVSCRRSECRTQAVRGGPVARERFRFTRPLPLRDVTVSLEETNGRGEIRLLAQPLEENDFTASVRIRDRQGGSGEYSFTLVWSPPARNGADTIARHGMTWSGRVDGRVRVTIEGNQASSEAISGAPVSGERADFSRALPARTAPFATVRRVRGRGRVEIVEFPSARNRHRLVFEIDDSKGGSDQYQVEVGW